MHSRKRERKRKSNGGSERSKKKIGIICSLNVHYGQWANANGAGHFALLLTMHYREWALVCTAPNTGIYAWLLLIFTQKIVQIWIIGNFVANPGGVFAWLRIATHTIHRWLSDEMSRDLKLKWSLLIGEMRKKQNNGPFWRVRWRLQSSVLIWELF